MTAEGKLSQAWGQEIPVLNLTALVIRITNRHPSEGGTTGELRQQRAAQCLPPHLRDPASLQPAQAPGHDKAPWRQRNQRHGGVLVRGNDLNKGNAEVLKWKEFSGGMRYRLRAGSLENWKVGFKALGCWQITKIIMAGTAKRHEGKGIDSSQYEE